ncbi:MAG: D-glycero-beta-D-manno-heptose 1-phosphate adenylyltransferase [Bacteroidales bacterium]|nr:D-glycero-beta-D-manno-heptose 1-phosphate adenylyltransferase [Bacteroidales bacterium]
MKTFERIQSKIMNLQAMKQQLAIWKFQEKKIVFTNGCFDILHLGHIDYLSQAKDQGDILVLGLNSDSSVRRIKGESRPIINEKARATAMAALAFIDLVVLFDEETPYELIQLIQPDVLVKGADYKAEDIVGYDILMAKGGEVKTISLTEGYSTTNIIEKIKKAY